MPRARTSARKPGRGSAGTRSKSSPAAQAPAADTAQSLEMVVELDAQDAQSLRLELRRLARKHGITLEELRIDEVDV
jgi:hypothetical protein